MKSSTAPTTVRKRPAKSWCEGKWTYARPIERAWTVAAGRPGIYVLYRRRRDGTLRALSGGKADNLTTRLQSHARSDSRLRGRTSVDGNLYASYCLLETMTNLTASVATKTTTTKAALRTAEKLLPVGRKLPGDQRRELPDVRLEMAEFLYELASELATPSEASREAAFR